MVIDIVIGAILLVALYIGYQRGVVQPLLVELFFLVAILAILRDRHAYTLAMEKYLHANAVFDVFLALIIAVAAGYVGGTLGGVVHKMPAVRGADGFLGIFIHGGFAVIVIYLLLSALIVLDKAFAPTLSSARLTYAQVEATKRQLASNPLTASLVDSRDIARLEKQARTPGGANIAETPQLNQLQTVYQDFLQPQLASSRAAPVILAIGHRLPVIGHIGPRDLPASTARTTTPSPSPVPTRKP